MQAFHRRFAPIAVLLLFAPALAVNVREGEVAIVMMDTQKHTLDDWVQDGCNVEQSDYMHMHVATLTYFANLQYAQKHGYKLFYYWLQGEGCAQYKCGAGCIHHRWGARHPSYCKIAGLGAALDAGSEWVVYVDSDAYFASGESLPELLHQHGANDLSADVFFGWDHPYSLGPNMGFIVLRNTPLTRELVNTWWNLDSGQYSTVHPFEQQTMAWSLMHMARFQTRMMTLHLKTMDPAAASSGAAVVHLDHNAGTDHIAQSL